MIPKAQRSKRKRLAGLLACLLALSACAGHQKALEKAREYEAAGLYVQAVEEDLRALEKKSDFPDALAHLKKMAPLAVRELRQQAEALAANRQWLEAANHYRQLEALLQRCRQHNVSLAGENPAERLAEIQRSGAADYAARAEDALADGNLPAAIELLKKVHHLLPGYRDNDAKLRQALVEQGTRQQQTGSYATAIATFREAIELTGEHPRVLDSLAAAYYAWGEQLEAAGDFRQAMARFEDAATAVPDFRDALERAQHAYEAAVRHVAILPLRNDTTFPNEHSHFLTETLRRICIDANLKFTDFLPSNEIADLVDRHRLRRARELNLQQAQQIGELEGVHAFVTGALAEIAIVRGEPKVEEKTLERIISERDSSGKKVESKETAYYRIYTATHTLRIRAYLQVTDAVSGVRHSREYVTDEVKERAQWLRYQGSIHDLPKEVRHLLDAPDQPTFSSLAINQLLDRVAAKMAHRLRQRFE